MQKILVLCVKIFEKPASETSAANIIQKKKSCTETLKLNFNVPAEGIKGKSVLYIPHNMISTF